MSPQTTGTTSRSRDRMATSGAHSAMRGDASGRIPIPDASVPHAGRGSGIVSWGRESFCRNGNVLNAISVTCGARKTIPDPLWKSGNDSRPRAPGTVVAPSVPDSPMTNVRHAVRALRKSPGFSAVAVLTIAVGIGANTALFSVYDRLVLNPGTIPKPSTLVALWINNPQLNFNAPAMSWPRYEDLRDHATAFESLGISAFDNFTLTGNGDPEQLNGQRVSASFLPTLGILPALGRNFTAEQDVPNGPSVCIISYELWQTRFGKRDSLLGATILLNGQPWEVVGIMPPRGRPPCARVQVFAPRVFEVGGLTPVQVQNGAGYAQPIARLKPGISLQRAASELLAIGRSYREQFATKLDANSASEPHMFVAALVGNLEPTFYTLLGAVSFVLLIACANVASLFLGRLTARHK